MTNLISFILLFLIIEIMQMYKYLYIRITLQYKKILKNKYKLLSKFTIKSLSFKRNIQ